MEFSTKSTLAHTELINMHACIVRIMSYVATPWYVGRAVSALLTYRFSTPPSPSRMQPPANI